MSHVPYEKNTRTFVLKIWIEGQDRDDGEVVWRGYITDVMEQKPYHFDSLETVVHYLIERLKELGVEGEIWPVIKP